ncbi:putative integral membrane protein [Aspergillus sclerotioniger CBS 115572]|uniref:Putative integral membrane protein n=1 Tax=Aspergillus sclerotioniger CBS 115572 TaxID=1450535 RepID=A0A317XA05_9EURO|nr:putative integral membrane protein [Aspergillus sclerotioniger CBS 115572]PWY95436.1 putative integral membrane protein [Aspergillus sclerotioniger CBS 115572]
MAKDDRSPEVKAVAAAFMAVACVTVILRCYVRGWIVRAFGWDDWAMVVAMFFYAMFSGCMIGGAIYGTGRRFEVLTAHERVTAMEYWWFCEIAYCFSAVACKISVCIFLMRITVRRIHIWILWTVMVMTVVAGMVFMFIMLLQCKPLTYFWTRKAFSPDIHGHCMDIQIVIAMTYVYSGFAALCDFTVGILPIFLVRKLHMKQKTKMAVVGILSMACIASSGTIIRIPWVHTFADWDFLYATVEIALWSNIEVGLGITAGSLATLRPLLRQWLGSSADHNYDASPFPGPSGSRPLNLNKSGGVGRSHDRPYPLGSLDDTGVQGRLRPDKLAVTVTTIQSQVDPDTRPWRGGTSNSSEERLTGSAGSGGRSHGTIMENGDLELGLGIHRTFEVTQTSSSGGRDVQWE